jgi:hypothetical protein
MEDLFFDKVPSGFESAHEEWLKVGGDAIRQEYLHGSQPAFYRTTYWKLVREAIFKRDSFQCRRCGKEAEQVHHLSYVHRGRDHLYPEKLISVCYSCHGLVEHARKAESLAATLRYRLECIEDHLADKPAPIPETPLKSLSRVLEYRSRLSNLRNAYQNSEVITDQKSPEAARDFEADAKKILKTWHIAGKDKSKRIKAMLVDDMKSCADLIKEVFTPTSM